MNRKYSIIILALVGAAFVVLSLLRLLSKQDEQIPFDIAGWNAPMTDSHGMFTGARLKMANDLLRRYDFHGWNIQEVQSLIGQPAGERFEGQKHLFEYDLRDGLNLLIFEVDGQQRVVDYQINRDD